MLPNCCDPDALEKSLRKWGYERPNRIQLKALGWTPIEVSRPSYVIPIAVPSGYLASYPGIYAKIPAATLQNLDILIMPGGGWAFCPAPGQWSIYNSGNDTPYCIVMDVSSGPNALLSSCWDGAYVDATHTTATANVASSTALAANARATYRFFQNDSANTIYLRCGAAAAASTGIRLNANGGSYEMSKKNGNLFKGTVNCIAAAGASTLLVLEGGPPVPT